eukprot:112845-Amphidinium_carterae.1
MHVMKIGQRCPSSPRTNFLVESDKDSNPAPDVYCCPMQCTTWTKKRRVFTCALLSRNWANVSGIYPPAWTTGTSFSTPGPNEPTTGPQHLNARKETPGGDVPGSFGFLFQCQRSFHWRPSLCTTAKQLYTRTLSELDVRTPQDPGLQNRQAERRGKPRRNF